MIKLSSLRGMKQSHIQYVIASGAMKSLCGEANSSRSSACYEFASSFLLAMTKRFVFI